MILSDRDLRERLERGDLVVDPLDGMARGSKYQGQRGPVVSRISNDKS